MKSVAEMKAWFERLEKGGALYVWGMNGEVITEKIIKATYQARLHRRSGLYPRILRP